MKTTSRLRRAGFAAAAPLLVLSLSGCGVVNKMAANSITGLMEATTEVWSSGDDPEFVCESIPFALSTVEGLLAKQPESQRLLFSATQGFTQYAYVCVETGAILLEEEDYERSREQYDRALGLYLRAKGYGLRALELRHAGLEQGLLLDPDSAVAVMTLEDVPLLYWTAAAWGSAISRGKDRPDLIADLPAVIAMMERVLDLEEDFGEGAIHEVFVMLRGLPRSMGGSPEAARAHFERALELNGGRQAGTYATYATSVMLPEQDREVFERLMLQALAIDPDAEPSRRLQNLVAQRRARHMLDHVEDYFLE
ncbi:MAG: TRAP transporter TatT component family protein [Gemmatimonadota bacterium]|jgi:predicted anti-sigma-YlaC factor YlaD|nr:MAG: TRAP transporter TatT component family protein [Gemmatimonadota bacterium]